MQIPEQAQKQFQSTLVQQGLVSSQKLAELMKKTNPQQTLEKILVKEKLITTQELKKIYHKILKPKTTPKKFGKYLVIEKIAQGAMGVVYKVKHQELHKIYALKVVLHDSDSPEETKTRFHREAKMTAKLKHPNIVQVVDSGKEGSQHYFVMEYVEGQNLEEKIEAGFSTTAGLQLMQKVLAGLQYAHSQGILHRDLKPSNIFITKDGIPKIGDFGLAKDQETISQTQQLTYAGEILGTPAYMAPEQAAGEIQLLDERADIYSIGACIYKILTLHCPFEHESIHKLFYKIITEDPQPPSHFRPEIHRDLDTIVLKSLEKVKTKRYESAKSLSNDIERFLKGFPIQAKAIGSLARLFKWTKRNAKIVLFSSLMFLICLSFFLYSSFLQYQKKTKQIHQIYQKAQKTRKNCALLTLPTKEAQEKKFEKLLSAFDELNLALAMAPQNPEIKAEKLAIGKDIIQLACHHQEYELATYLANELGELQTLTEKEKLIQKVKEERNKLLNQHLNRFNYWMKTLKSLDLAKGARENAIFEISKMQEEEIFEKLIKLLSEGTHYFLFSTNRQPKLDEFYQTIVEILGRLENLKAGKDLLESLQKLEKKISYYAIDKRPVSDAQFMIYLAQSLGNLRMPNVSSKLYDIRLSMGSVGIFYEGTEEAYQILAEIDQVKIEKPTTITSWKIYYQKGLNKFSIKDYENALEYFSKAIQINPKSALSYRGRGGTRLHQGNIEGAIQDFTQDILLTNSAYGYLNRGTAKSHLKDLKGAVQDYSKAIQKDPKLIEAYYNRANMWSDLAETEKAMQDYNKVLSMDPNHSRALHNRALLKRRLQNIKGAMEDFEETLRVNPNHTIAYLNRGSLKHAMKDFDGAIKDFTKALKLNPKLTAAYNNLALVKEDLGDLEGALIDLNEAIRIDPNFSQGYNNRGNLRLKKKNLREAMMDFNQAIRLNPSYADAFLNRGNVKMQQKKNREALNDYNRAIQIDPNFTDAYNTRAALKRAFKDYEGAIKDFSKAIQLSPQSAQLYTARASLYHLKNKLKQAIQDYNQALSLNPGDLLAYTNRGQVKVSLKDYQGAIKDYKKAMKIDPNYGIAYYNLGSLYQSQRDIAAAKEQFQHYLKLTQQLQDPLTLKNHQNIFKIYPEMFKSKSNASLSEKRKTEAFKHYKRGQKEQEKGSFAEALKAYKAALLQMPKEKEILYQKSIVEEELKKFDAAILTLKKLILLEKKPAHQERLLDLLLHNCSQQIRQKLYKRAQISLKEFLQLAPPHHPNRPRVEKLLKQLKTKRE